MTYDEIEAKIDNKEYNSKLDYASDKKAWRVDSDKLQAMYKADLRRYFEATLGKPLTDKQFESAYNFAWEEGHAYGYHEVLIDASNLADVLSEFAAANKP